MNLSLRLNTTASKIAVWTAQNPLATRIVMLALPITIVAVASIFALPTPPTGCTTPGGGC
jgi:hypothetical protein